MPLHELGSRVWGGVQPIHEWGRAEPLEKVLATYADFERVLMAPHLTCNSITIIEPWGHVGHNPLGEEVRASVNVAYVAQMIADCDSMLYPAWSTGLLNLDKLIPTITTGVAVVVEGGDQAVYKPESMKGAALKHEELCMIVDRLLLARAQGTCPSIFICLGHQLAAHCHIRLIRRVVAEVLHMEDLGPGGPQMLADLKAVAHKIKALGDALPARKHDSEQLISKDCKQINFSASRNEESEIAYAKLVPYASPKGPGAAHIPQELITAHEAHAMAHEGILDSMLEQQDVTIAMFYNDEVNEESANFAYNMIWDVAKEHRRELSGMPLSWLLKLPKGVEILASTLCESEGHDGGTLTEVAYTCIAYVSHEDGSIRRSFTCQFHPELFDDFRVFGDRPLPSYEELRKENSIELLVRMLYAGMQE